MNYLSNHSAMPPGCEETAARGTSADGNRTEPVTTYFQLLCPTCGRRLLIRIEYLGEAVSCRHCGRRFVAKDDLFDDDEILRRNQMVLEWMKRIITALESTG